MIEVNLTEVKNRFSHYLRLVKTGETIQILDRDVPVARLERISGSPTSTEPVLERLVEAGIVTPPRHKRSAAEILKKPLVRCKKDVVKILVEERGDR